MRRQTWRFSIRASATITLFVVTMLLASVAPTRPGFAATKRPVKSSRIPARTPKTKPLVWTRCDGPVECTTLAMPIDAANPLLGTTRVAIGRVRAKNAKTRRGVLFVNPGGPGGSAIDLVRSIAEDRSSAEPGKGFDDWDVVGVDPRGVGRSDQIRCGTKLTELGINPFAAPTNDDRARARNAWVQTCIALSGPLVLHSGTIDAADDLDRVRIALGEERIDFLGYSYGTVIGAVYAARYGRHVRSMVLDAAVDPSLYGSSSFIVGAAAGMERRVADFSTSCSASEKCSLRNASRATPEQISKSIDETIRLIEAKVSPEIGLRIRSQVYGLLEESANWAGAADYVTRLEKVLEADLAGVSPSSSPVFDLLTGNAAYWAVSCTDGAFPNSATDFTSASSAVQSNSPIVGSVMLYLADLCVDWPAPRPLGDLTAKTSLPVLVIGGLRDTRTPIEWSQGLVAQLGNARLVVRDGDGHASYPRSACVRRTVSAYMNDNALPADDTTCG